MKNGRSGPDAYVPQHRVRRLDSLGDHSVPTTVWPACSDMPKDRVTALGVVKLFNGYEPHAVHVCTIAPLRCAVDNEQLPPDEAAVHI